VEIAEQSQDTSDRKVIIHFSRNKKIIKIKMDISDEKQGSNSLTFQATFFFSFFVLLSKKKGRKKNNNFEVSGLRKFYIKI